ncbi:hypothetical protein [Belnapia moabensis]|uniref:hypothetical protein n=1 Tax=Belnapia moabensis TaxID=365533 RepID=UPI0005B85C5B|nr:hypothetical protein [Belnapia moabensis]
MLRSGAGVAPRACLVVARGRFGTTLPTALPPTSGLLTRRHLQDLGLTVYPPLYVEVSIRSAPDANAATRAVAGAETGTRFTAPARRGAPPRAAATAEVEPAYLHLLVRPEALQFAHTAARRPGDGQKAIGMLVLLRAEPFGRGATEAQAREGALLALPLDFGVVREGTAVAAPAGAAGAAHPFANQERAVRVPALSATANADAFVTEAGEPSRVLDLLAATLKDNETPVEKAIADAVRAAVSPPAGPQ